MEFRVVKPLVWNFSVVGGCEAWKEVVYSARLSGVPPEVRDVEVFRMIVENDYRSAVEHVIVKYDVKMSKGNAPEFLEHRMASHSGYSTRYVEACKGVDKEKPVYEVILPLHILQKDLRDICEKDLFYAVKSSAEVYDSLVSRGVPREVARYVLSFAQAVGVYHVSMNLRSLLNLLSLRLCVRSSPEFRCIASQLYFNLLNDLPMLRGLVGCRGFMNGVCPENNVTGVRVGRQHPYYPPCIFRDPESTIYIPTARELRGGVNVKPFSLGDAVEAQERLYSRWASWE